MFVFEGAKSQEMQVLENQKALNPGKELSKEKMQAISTFMPLLKTKRTELKERMDKESQLLLKMVCMFLFHAHLLILKSDSFTKSKKEFKSDENKQLVRNYFS
jgi:hypothetical protein